MGLPFPTPRGAPHTVTEWFNTSPFQAPRDSITVVRNNLSPILTLGNAGSAPVVRPAVENWDIEIHKNFPFKERFRLQFRAEMFNAFNKANFGDPDTTLGDATCGQISSATPGRQIQLR